jgi:hypothetical protein
VDGRVQVPVFTDGRAARHRFALVQTQGLRRRDAAELLVVDGPAARPHVPCLQKTETRRGELFAPPPTRGRSPRRGRRGSGRRVVADEGPVTVPLRTRARSPRRLRRGLGRRAAPNEDERGRGRRTAREEVGAHLGETGIFSKKKID